MLAAADLDSDGWIDLAAALVFDQRARHSARERLRVHARGHTRHRSVSARRRVGDLNLDGRLDVATANYAAHSVTVLLGRAAARVPDRWGELPSAPAPARSPSATSTTMAAWTSRPAGRPRPRLWIHDNSTFAVRGGFSFRRKPIDAFGESLAAGDVNENGRIDLLGNGAVLLDGTTRVSLPVPANHRRSATLLVDYTRDGHQDAVLSLVQFDDQGRLVSNSIVLYAGDGRGGFASPVDLAAGRRGCGSCAPVTSIGMAMPTSCSWATRRCTSFARQAAGTWIRPMRWRVRQLVRARRPEP